MKIIFTILRAGSVLSFPHCPPARDARKERLSQMALVVFVLGLGADGAAGADSPCVAHSFEYRSCSASRNWCGFPPYVPVTPTTKYRTQTMQDSASGYDLSAYLAASGSAMGTGLRNSVEGQILFSASGTTTNWGAECHLNPSQVGFIHIEAPQDVILDQQPAGSSPPWMITYRPGGVSARIQFDPTVPGSEVRRYDSDCTIITTTVYPLVNDYALVGQSISATTSNLVNTSSWTAASRSFALSDESKRETVEAAIISQDLSSCPTGGWSRPAIAASSSMIGNSVSVTKVGYQIKLPQTEPDTTYLLSWKVRVYDASGNLSSEEPAEASLQGTGGEISTEEMILLPPLNVGGSKIVDEASLEIRIVNGGGGCCGGSVAAGQGSTRLDSVEVEIGLGTGRFGRGGGQLYINQESLDGSSATPASLKFAGDTNQFEVINDAGGIRQVLGAQALADVIATSQYGYEIRLYSVTNVGAKVGGTYTVSNPPHTIWTVRNPDVDLATNRLQAIETRGSKAITNEYQWSATNQTWTYISGNGLRTETKSIEWDATNKVRSEIRKTFTGTNELVQQQVKKYKIHAFGMFAESVGMVLDETRIGLPGSEITTTNTYINNLIAPRLDTVTRSDGSWETYSFDGQGRVLLRYFSCYFDQGPVKDWSRTRYTQYYYTPFAGSGDDGSATNSEPRTTYQGIFGQIFSSSFLVRRPDERIEIQPTKITGNWDDATHLFTTHRYYTNGTFRGYLQSTFRPDGTAALYSYATDSTQSIITVLAGQPDPANATNILDGTKTVTVVGLAGQTFSNVVYAVPQTDIILSQEIYSDFDEVFRARRITYLDGTFKQVSYDCCGLEYEIDRDGSRTDYTYDDLKRLQTATRNGVTTLYTYDGAGRLLSTTRRGRDNSSIVLDRSVYDAAGRLTARTNALGQPTLFSETVVNHQTLKVVVNPDGGTITNFLARDGSLLEVSGSAARPIRYLYDTTYDGVSGSLFTTRQEIRLATSGATNEWVQTLTDPAGRLYKTIYSAAQTPLPFDRFTYNPKGLLTNQVDADGIITLFRYNEKAEREYTILDTDRNSTIDYAGMDRITRTVNDIITNGSGFVVRRTSVYLWSTNNSAVSNLISTTETSTDGLRSWSSIWNNGTPVTRQSHIVYDAATGYRYVTNTAPDNSYSVAITRHGTNVSVTQFDALDHQLAAINYSYDAHGRPNTVTDARIGTTRYTFNHADQVTTVTTPDPGPGAQTTTIFYDTMGRVWKTTLPDNTSVTNEYFLTGQLKKTYGSRTYPVVYTYDAQGRLKTMKTWQDFAGNSGTAATIWNYDLDRGWLTNKTYDGGAAGPTYTYTAAGRLATRTWARGLATTYSHNNAGDLSAVFYSDGTAGVTNAYNRLGLPMGVTSGGTVCAFTYNEVNQLLGETYTGGPLNGFSLTNGYDRLLRRTAVGVSNYSTTLTTYGYDHASRLKTVTSGATTASYTYLANSPLVAQIAFTNDQTLRMTLTKQYDLLNRLTSITNQASASPAIGFRYVYNSVNQRTSVTNAEGARWVYQYDSLGQVVSGKKYWSDGTQVAGQQFEYTFDDIGNRKTAASGGDQFGVNLRSAGYTNNALNQVTSRGVPGFVDILGSAANSATVTVNNQPTYRYGDYFRAELTVTNPSAPVFLGITNVAVLNNGTNVDIVSSVIGHALVAQAPEAFTYDADGNLTSDGLWTNTWNGENRLLTTESTPGVPTAAKRKVDYTYDYSGRMIQRIASTNNGTAYAACETNRFIYDGSVQLAELDAGNNLVKSYLRGLDLSGSLQGAGGVGGLLAINAGINGFHFYCHDGNGNVMALVNSSTGGSSADFDYTPFGQILRATGPMAFINALGFSGQYRDSITRDILYLYRTYNPDAGRWLSRDPIGEQGGLNVYGSVGNDSLNGVDSLGLAGYFFDGTNNDGDRDRPDDPNAPNGPTNVKILYDIYGVNGESAWYLAGVGTRESSKLKKSLGLAFGYGGEARISDMMEHLRTQIKNGDCDVDVFGFSRGAAQAREFVYRVHGEYPDLKIRFLGIFDTVLSTPNPGDYHLKIPDAVQTVIHPVALGERRSFFPLSSIRTGPNARITQPDWWEFGLPGAHSDVGGGYTERRQFANLALKIVHEQGLARGVPFGPLPADYLDTNTKGLNIHDSGWANDKVRDFRDWYNNKPKRPREIIYNP